MAIIELLGIFQVIEPLVLPKDSEARSFHVIAMDLPGYSLSPDPVLSKLGSKQLAIAFDNLMRTPRESKCGVSSTDQRWGFDIWMSYFIPDARSHTVSISLSLDPQN
ncbi:hypothetical protein HJFPF1_05767 [Paramyrothecium foliicola]|nr:hypothetical protein HJFPF1_05767 [Paramyrothecium foliicola]